MFLTIITASYNRAYCLPNIYSSLLTNDEEDFEWIIVDDGSKDDTKEVVESWILENRINIKYIKQKNSGKTLSIINGFKQDPKGRFTLVLDSDDFLVDKIIRELKSLAQDLPKSCVGFVGLKSDTKGHLIGSRFKKSSASYIELYFGADRVYGDKLFILKTDIYSKSIMPPFEGEKFMPDHIPFLQASRSSKFICLNQILYKGDYLTDGMTSNVLRVVAKNIRGFIFDKLLLQKERLPVKDRIVNEAKYIAYSVASGLGMKAIVKKSNQPVLTAILFVPTILIFKNKIKSIKSFRHD